MITLKVKENRTGPLRGRHPWVFSQAITNIPEGLEPGGSVRVESESGAYLGTGYFSSYSQIAVRLWGYDENENVDKDFFKKRIEKALSIRRGHIENENTDSYRLINGENDLLPGLIVDKYANFLVLQCHTQGISKWKQEIVGSLIEVLNPDGIYERSESLRHQSDDAGVSGLLTGDVPDIVTIKENGFRFLVDIKKGQKTGFFLDQRDKRNAVRGYSKGKSVLNCFSYTGAFSVYALSGGAEKAVCVDTSQDALALAKENIKLNGLDLSKCDFVSEDVKKYLRSVPRGTFDLIILDPPAFIKDRKKKADGLVGYKGINESALSALPEGGILVTSSCSAHLTLQEFRYLLSEAGGKTRKTVRVLETFQQGVDHPVLAAFTEGDYLKCFIATV